MASLKWVGTDAGNEGDWGVAANFVPAQVPVSGDDVSLTSGSQSVTAGLDQNLVDLNSLVIGPEYTGNVGTSGSPLIIGSGKTVIDSGGNVYLSSTATLTQDQIDVRNSKNKLVELTSAAGGVAALSVKNGPCVLKSGTFTTVIGSFTARGMPVISAETATVTTAHVNAGHYSHSGAATTTNLHVRGNGIATIATGTLTNATTHSDNARCVWETTATLSSLIVYAGEFDASGDPLAKTITAAEVHGTGRINLDNGADNITVTTASKYGPAAKFATTTSVAIL